MNEVIREYRSFSDSIPAAVRDEVWVPYATVTLAFLPCGYTSYVCKRCPALMVEKEYVQLTRPTLEEIP